MNNHVIITNQGHAGIILLNRPQALNALDADMICRIQQAFHDFSDDPKIRHIILKGAGGKAFCAGADVRQIASLVTEGKDEEAFEFFENEYRLNRMISLCPKPVLSLLDGITMGGGVGLAHHGTYRIASEKYVFAMPEVTIGFFPDVGIAHILAHLPKQAGLYLGMTGNSLSLHSAFHLGLVTHRVPSASFSALEEALTESLNIDDTLKSFVSDDLTVSSDDFQINQDLIEKFFSQETAWNVMDCLKEEAGKGNSFASATYELLKKKCPHSLVAAFEHIRTAAHLSLEEVFLRDMILVKKMIPAHDFAEGVRAQLIDKDKKPCWKPEKLDASLKEFAQSLFI